jgi:CBS-domain-containing membrane protein
LSFIVLYWFAGADTIKEWCRHRSILSLDLSKLNPVCQVLKTSPLWECIGLFQKGVHRVAVINEEKKVINVLSQSDIVRFLASKMDQYYSFFGKV